MRKDRAEDMLRCGTHYIRAKIGLLTVFGRCDSKERGSSEEEEAAGLDVALDRQFSASVDQVAATGLPAQLFCMVVLFCVLSVACVNGAIAVLPSVLCEVVAFGDSLEWTEQ